MEASQESLLSTAQCCLIPHARHKLVFRSRGTMTRIILSSEVPQMACQTPAVVQQEGVPHVVLADGVALLTGHLLCGHRL